MTSDGPGDKYSFESQQTPDVFVVETEEGRIVLVPQPTRSLLNQKQIIDYRKYRKQLIAWMLYQGKAPDEAEGHTFDVVKPRANDIDRFHRFVWQNSDAPTRDAGAVHDQIKTLTQLHGVGPAIASTILTFRAPEVYTVMDWRAIAALAEEERWNGEAEADIGLYPQYLDCCHSLSEQMSITLRDVDRVLWVLGPDDSDGS